MAWVTRMGEIRGHPDVEGQRGEVDGEGDAPTRARSRYRFALPLNHFITRIANRFSSYFSANDSATEP